MTIITLENAKDLYLTTNTFETKEEDLTTEERNYIVTEFNRLVTNGYEIDNILYYIAIDFDTNVVTIKNIVKAWKSLYFLFLHCLLINKQSCDKFNNLLIVNYLTLFITVMLYHCDALSH